MNMKHENKTDIFFDLDDTLWDFQRNANAAFEYILREFDMGLDIKEFIQVYSPINQKYWKLYRAKEIDRIGLQSKRFEETFAELGLGITPEEGKSIMDAYSQQLVKNGYLIMGTLDTMDYLFPWYNLHILTDGFVDIQDKKLKFSRIYDYFKTVTASDEVGTTKPDYEIFEKALHKAKTRKKDSVMIGDNLDFDVHGAEEFGMDAIHYVPSGKTSYQGDFITEINELKNIF